MLALLLCVAAASADAASVLGPHGAFVLRDLATGKTERANPAQAARRESPMSTYKIFNSLVGLETGVLTGPEHVIKWDGTKHPGRPQWDRDQTLRTAIRESVVWYYQRVAAGVGLERMQRYVSAAHYGNEDLSGGITQFWLSSSLAISADEQVELLQRLVRGELPFSARAQAVVRDITTLRETPRGVLHGKTGTCDGRGCKQEIGWFVGWVEHGKDVHVFAANVLGPKSGPEVRAMVERILEARGLL